MYTFILLRVLLGQFCNDEDSRSILTKPPHDITLECWMYVFDESGCRIGRVEGFFVGIG